METTDRNYCVILAGGVGRRLWPASDKELPKQFIDFFGSGRTLLQETYDRFVQFIPPEHIYVSTYQGYVDIVREQLPILSERHILSEPVQLNTAPACIWATWHVLAEEPEACIVTTPADQFIRDRERFAKQLGEGLDYVDTHEDFLAVGVRPTLPNTAYGYVQMGESVDGGKRYHVQSFSEKPEESFARLFMESGEFLWNTGIFLWKGKTMAKHLTSVSIRPEVSPTAVAKQMVTFAEEMEQIRTFYPDGQPRSIDLLVLERSKNVVVQECNFGWADVGCWTEMREVLPNDADGNAVSGGAKVMFSGTQHCMVRLPKEMKAVVAGLDGFLVALKGDTLMICPNKDSDQVRRLINEALVEL